MANTNPPPTLRPGRPEAAAAVWDWRGGQGHASHNPDGHRAAPSDQQRRQLRRQGLIQALVGAAAGTLIFFFWHRELAYVVWAIAGFTLVAALVSPGGLYAAIGRALALFGHWVGRVLTVVLMVPVFFAFFTVFGGLFRRGRRDRLQRFFDPEAATYWRRRPTRERCLADYERQS